jgi:hypothetical protein
MLVRSLMIGVGSLALGCSSSIELGSNDAGGAARGRDGQSSDAAMDGVAAEARDGHSGDAATDGGSASESTLKFTYCSYTSDAGAPTCYGLAPWTPSPAESAQAQLNCMTEHGSIVSLCPSDRLVGCCSTQVCPPPPPGQSEDCGGSGQEQPGVNVRCSYDEDAGTTHVQDLECVAAGGTWTTTPPQ